MTFDPLEYAAYLGSLDEDEIEAERARVEREAQFHAVKQSMVNNLAAAIVMLNRKPQPEPEEVAAS